MSPTPDGLAALSAQRERARRVMPPPRHPSRSPASDPLDRAAPAASPADKPPVTTPQIPPAKASTPARTIEDADVTQPSLRVTLYIDRPEDEFMEAVRIAGLSARPRLDVSRSAVVRLAMRRLMGEMSPNEVQQLLASQPVKTTGPGRKRR